MLQIKKPLMNQQLKFQRKKNLKDYKKEANILKELEGPGFFPKVINYSEDAPIKKVRISIDGANFIRSFQFFEWFRP